MKKINTYIFLFVMFFSLTVSCDEDDSLTYEKEYNTIKISSYHADNYLYLTANIGETFTFNVDSVTVYNGNQEPRIITQEDSDEFDFEWWFARNSKDEPVLSELICESYELSLFVNRPIGIYSIVFLVRDKASGLEYYRRQRFQVVSALGNGLVVAHTKDGVSSQVSEIKSAALSYDYAGEEYIYHDVIPGGIGELIKDIAYYRDFYGSTTVSRLAIATDNNVEVRNGNYELVLEGDDAFWLAPVSILPDYFERGSNASKGIFVNNGKLHAFSSNKFTAVFSVKDSDITDYSVNKVWNTRKAGVVYDELNNRFLGLVPGDAQLIELTTDHLTPEEKIIDFNNVGNMDALSICGVGDADTHLAVLKNNDDNKIYGYSFRTGGSYNPWTGVTIVNNDRQKIVEMTGLPGFDGTNLMQGLERTNSSVVYYVAGNKLYAFSLDSDILSAHLVYEANAGDEIVDISNNCLGGSSRINITNISDPNGDPIQINPINRFITLAINSASGEGRIVGIPVVSPNDVENGLEKNPGYIKEWTGFGRILSTSYTALHR